jgi:hypothetical protein
MMDAIIIGYHAGFGGFGSTYWVSVSSVIYMQVRNKLKLNVSMLLDIMTEVALVVPDTVLYVPSRNKDDNMFHDVIDDYFPRYVRNRPRVKCGCAPGKTIPNRQALRQHCEQITHKTWLASEFPRQLEESAQREKQNRNLTIELRQCEQQNTRLKTEKRALLQKNELITQLLGIAEAERDIATRELEVNRKSIRSAIEHLNLTTSAYCFERDDTTTA